VCRQLKLERRQQQQRCSQPSTTHAAQEPEPEAATMTTHALPQWKQHEATPPDQAVAAQHRQLWWQSRAKSRPNAPVSARRVLAK
jgi:hypothetical protein